MNITYLNEMDIPKDWPANAIECQLENIMLQLDNFNKKPNYKNREVLISLVTDYDLNQRPALGLFRTTKYEIGCINAIFMEANWEWLEWVWMGKWYRLYTN